LHRQANLAYKVLDINLMSGENEKCLCCNQPIPSEDHYFSPCADNIEFAKLGAAGFPLLFEFNKQICLLFLVMTLLYFVPMYVYFVEDLESANSYKDAIPDFSDIGLNSIGILFYDPVTPEGLRYFESEPDV
jgi:hypothetical protein